MLRKKIKTNDSLLADINQPKDKQNRLRKTFTWVRQNPKKSIPLLMLTIILAISIVYLLWPRSEPNKQAAKKPEPAKTAVFYSPLTGSKVSEAETKLPVIGVMIENSPEARPQSGLAEAGVVFESIAEGGITRFLALYQEGKPAKIGPVRSVRPQHASWVAAFDAGLAHVGGSDIPLKKLRSGKIKDLDQFFNAGAYYRSNERYAPHNMYTSHKRLHTLALSKGYKTSNFTGWQRLQIDGDQEDQDKETAKTPAPKATSINVPISSSNYNLTYTWNPKTKDYTRSMGGSVHKDQEKGVISPEVLIVMQVPHDTIRDSNGYSYPNVNTKGKAWLFQNGEVKTINWAKSSDNSQISFTGSKKEKVVLNPGQTWITAIRIGNKPSWK